MSFKKIVSKQKAQRSNMGPHVRQVIPSAVENLDPFVFLDHFGPFVKQPGAQGVLPHPHAGIATITYLLEGSNKHQDSYGHEAIVNSGDLAWMQAGRGIIHAEGMNENKTEPQTVHGLQIWISLPAKDKFIEPHFFLYAENDLPVFKMNGATIKVLCGQLFDHKAPTKSLSPAYIYFIEFSENTMIELPIKLNDTCGVYVMEGEITLDSSIVPALCIAEMDTHNDTLQLHANIQSKIVVLGGTPLNEPILGYASYVMNTEEQIHQVMRDYKAGKMGKLELQK